MFDVFTLARIGAFLSTLYHKGNLEHYACR